MVDILQAINDYCQNDFMCWERSALNPDTSIDDYNTRSKEYSSTVFIHRKLLLDNHIKSLPLSNEIYARIVEKMTKCQSELRKARDKIVEDTKDAVLRVKQYEEFSNKEFRILLDFIEEEIKKANGI